MRKGREWLWILVIVCLMVQPGFASSVAQDEVSGRGGESPVAMLALEEGIVVAFQKPGRIVFYNHEWVENNSLDLPEEFIVEEMIQANEFLWLLDEWRGVVLQIEVADLQIIASYGGTIPHTFVSIYEANGAALLMDDRGNIHQVDEEYSILSRISGVRLFQAAMYDGNYMYLGGRIRPAESGVLVKTSENVLEDEWLMSDDSRAPVDKDVVERIKLLPDGFFYVVYRNTGIVKYDEYGNFRNRIYQKTEEGRIFKDIVYSSQSGKTYMVDQNAGIFEVTWSNDRRIYSRKRKVDFSASRLYTRTVKGVTSAQVGEGKLSSFYREDEGIRLIMPTRNANLLKVRLPAADLIDAQAKGFELLQVLWNDNQYAYQISEWVLEMREEENIEEQYVEIQINGEKNVTDFCWVERLDEKTKTVRRERLE